MKTLTNFEIVFGNVLNFCCHKNGKRMFDLHISKGYECLSSKLPAYQSCVAILMNNAEANDYSFFASTDECKYVV